MLNEGWDVLNLFDIVRLYDTRDARGNKPGKTTMQEAQLIGRGARYFAFNDPNKPEKMGMRKYDDDMDNPLRVIEKLHYHSQHNPRYIQELRSALVSTGIMAEQYIEVEENLKEEFKLSRLYKSGVIFKNEQKEIAPEEKNVDGLSDTIRNKRYEVTMPTGQQKSGDIFGRYAAPELTAQSRASLKFSDLGENVVRTAINCFAELHFDKLHALFPSLTSIRMFMQDARYLSRIQFVVIGASDEIEIGRMSQKNKLYVATEVLRQIVPLLSKQEKQYVGTTEFKPADIKIIFRNHKLRFENTHSGEQIGKSMNNPYNTGYHLDLGTRNWYAYTDCFGTSEEKELVKYIDSIYKKLHDKYSEEVWLVRNELDFKIYNFEDGKAFAPDFVLFLRRKDGENYDNLQIFIEPKGTHLLANDQWKEDFLNQIQGADTGLFTLKGERFNIYGVPFFNRDSNRPEKLQNFEAQLKEITGLTPNPNFM